jgi:hypothetical protein
MAEITREKIRSTITFAGLTVVTPYIKSFSVNRQRGQASANFSATVEVPGADFCTEGGPEPVAEDIVITAGIEGDEKKIFTGEIRQVTIEPSWDKPEYFILQMSGNDVMIHLENRSFSRRIQWEDSGIWAKITGIERVHKKSGANSLDLKLPRGGGKVITKMPDPNDARHDSFIYARDLSRIDPYGKIQKPKELGAEYKEFTFTVTYVSAAAL